MCDQTEVQYLPGEVVWVKLRALWWPGQVQDYNALPEEITASLRKQPLAVVKFFQEDTYEYVHKLDLIYHYNCSRKHEFIKKGLDLSRKKGPMRPSNMDLFPSDVATAEHLTDGDPNIIKDDAFKPEEKPKYELLFGSEKKKIGKKKLQDKSPLIKDRAWRIKSLSTPSIGWQSRGIPPSVIKPSPDTPKAITHRRFLQKMRDGKSDYQVRILEQKPSEETPLSPSREYNCDLCGYVTRRVNVIILHYKASHYPKSIKSKTIRPLKLKGEGVKPDSPKEVFSEGSKRKFTKLEKEQKIKVNDKAKNAEREEEPEKKPKTPPKKRETGKKQRESYGKRKIKYDVDEDGIKKPKVVDTLLADWEEDAEQELEERERKLEERERQRREEEDKVAAEIESSTISKSKEIFDFNDDDGIDFDLSQNVKSFGRRLPRIIDTPKESKQSDGGAKKPIKGKRGRKSHVDNTVALDSILAETEVPTLPLIPKSNTFSMDVEEIEEDALKSDHHRKKDSKSQGSEVAVLREQNELITTAEVTEELEHEKQSIESKNLIPEVESVVESNVPPQGNIEVDIATEENSNVVAVVPNGSGAQETNHGVVIKGNEPSQPTVVGTGQCTGGGDHNYVIGAPNSRKRRRSLLPIERSDELLDINALPIILSEDISPEDQIPSLLPSKRAAGTAKRRNSKTVKSPQISPQMSSPKSNKSQKVSQDSSRTGSPKAKSPSTSAVTVLGPKSPQMVKSPGSPPGSPVAATTPGGPVFHIVSKGSSVVKGSISPVTSPKSPLVSPKSPLSSPKSPMASPKSPLASPKSPLASPKSPLASPKSPLASPKSPLASPKSPIGSPKSPVPVMSPKGSPNTSSILEVRSAKPSPTAAPKSPKGTRVPKVKRVVTNTYKSPEIDRKKLQSPKGDAVEVAASTASTSLKGVIPATPPPLVLSTTKKVLPTSSTIKTFKVPVSSSNPSTLLGAQAGTSGTPTRKFMIVQSKDGTQKKMVVQGSGSPQLLMQNVAGGKKIVVLTKGPSGSIVLSPQQQKLLASGGKVTPSQGQIVTSKGAALSSVTKIVTGKGTTVTTVPNVVGTPINVSSPIKTSKVGAGDTPTIVKTEGGKMLKIIKSPRPATQGLPTSSANVVLNTGGTMLVPVSSIGSPGTTKSFILPVGSKNLQMVNSKSGAGGKMILQMQSSQSKVVLPTLSKTGSATQQIRMVSPQLKMTSVVVPSSPTSQLSAVSSPSKVMTPKLLQKTTSTTIKQTPTKEKTVVTPVQSKALKKISIVTKPSPSVVPAGSLTVVSGKQKPNILQTPTKIVSKRSTEIIPMKTTGSKVQQKVVMPSKKLDATAASYVAVSEAPETPVATTATPTVTSASVDQFSTAQTSVQQLLSVPTEDGGQVMYLIDNGALLNLDGSSQTQEGTRTLFIDPSSLGTNQSALGNIIFTFDNTSSSQGSLLSVAEPTATSSSAELSFPLETVTSNVSSGQDILAEALANTQVLQSESTGNELSLDAPNILTTHSNYPGSVPTLSHGVLETTLTLNQPIMTPLEDLSAVSSLQPPPAAGSSLELPVTITQPDITISTSSYSSLPIPSATIQSTVFSESQHAATFTPSVPILTTDTENVFMETSDAGGESFMSSDSVFQAASDGPIVAGESMPLLDAPEES